MTDCKSKQHQRRSIRLKGYNYSRKGAYFVTVCIRNRACLFGEVVAGDMRLNNAGHAAKTCWIAIPDHFPLAALDVFAVMPNHVHGIIWIVDDPTNPDIVGAKNFSPLHSPQQNTTVFRSPTKTIGSIVRGFKIGVTKWMRANMDIHDVWQRNFYEHIIRDENALNRIRQYIAENPERWMEDAENPDNRVTCSANIVDPTIAGMNLTNVGANVGSKLENVGTKSGAKLENVGTNVGAKDFSPLRTPIETESGANPPTPKPKTKGTTA
ncbi:MAG: transposase [Pseudomonadota bacterium]